MLVDFGVTYVCKEKLGLHKYLANSLGFVLATISNYFLNRYWTFMANGHEARLMEFSKFFIIAVIGLAVNNAIVYVLNDRLKINFYLAKLGAVALVSIWNFLANYMYTFAS
ncbi:Putative flippase GtrA (transmembrane translocase of bactoprenol-linked glucose) [bacterium A37T11]|nr:Putative flippase GtrA (transmembrane translocase of bactoprenol-linked glucose) [bacterium A37T11]